MSYESSQQMKALRNHIDFALRLLTSQGWHFYYKARKEKSDSLKMHSDKIFETRSVIADLFNFDLGYWDEGHPHVE